MTILISFFSFLLLFYLFFLFRISKGISIVSKKNAPLSNNEFVSIIVPFRNEEENIKASLKSLTSQTLSKDKYEIIYVDDNSDDKTVSLLAESKKPNNIILLNSPVTTEERAHKKIALLHAINEAKGEIIITTDADCTHNITWLETMIDQFDERTAFVSGPVQFLSEGSLFSEIQKLEFSSLILVGAGLIGTKTPIICNAANLGFRKSVFTMVGGYDDNLSLTSGDDEFLMQKISRKTNYEIKFCFDKKAISYTHPNKNLNQFYQQRKRWASKGFHYVDKLIVLKLILIFLFYLGIPLQIILGIWLENIFLITAFISIIFKFIAEFKIVQMDAKKLFPKTKIAYFFISELFHIPYILISGISGIFGNYTWKGRTIKR